MEAQKRVQDAVTKLLVDLDVSVLRSMQVSFFEYSFFVMLIVTLLSMDWRKSIRDLSLTLQYTSIYIPKIQCFSASFFD